MMATGSVPAAERTWKRGSEGMMMKSRLAVLVWVGAVLLLGCSHSRNPTTLTKVVGDGQVGAPGGGLPHPLVVKVADVEGRPMAGVTVLWSVLEGGGSVKAAIETTGEDGLATALARLGPTAASNRYQASTQNWAIYSVTFQATHSPFTLSYTEPPPGGKLRLVRHPASTPSSIVLALQVAPGASVSAYSAGFNLPLDPSRVSLDRATPIIPGTVLDPGQSPPAVMAVLPQSGPLTGTLVSGQSQKASGIGAVTTDTLLPEGTVLYSVKLNVLPTATPGVVFDGTAPGFVLPSAGARDRLGKTVIAAGEVVIGQLVVK